MIHLNRSLQFTRFDGVQPKQNEEIETTAAKETENKEPVKKEVKYDSAKVSEYMNGFCKALKEMNCPLEQFGIILNTISNEINNYYAANGESGLTEHLNELFDKLVNAYAKNNPENSTKAEENENQTTTSEEKTINYEQKFESLKKELDSIQNEIGKIGEDFINNTEIPVPPNEKSFIGRNGKVDETAYEEAMKEYQQEFADYQKAKGEYYIKVAELQREAEKIKNEMDSVMFEASTSEIEEKINELRKLGDSDGADKLLEQLNNQKDKFNEYLKQELEADNKEIDLKIQLNQLIEPTAPSKIDYMNADGSINEAEYNKAMDEYKNDKQDFYKAENELLKQINNISYQIKIIQHFDKYSQNIVNDLYNATSSLCSIKEQMESVKDPDLKAEMQKAYENLVTIAENRTILANRENELWNDSTRPIPPSRQDFIVNGEINEAEYNKAMDKYNLAKIEYEKELTEYNKKLSVYQSQDKLFELEASNLISKCNNIADISNKLNKLQDRMNTESDPVLKSQLQKEYNELKELGTESIKLNNNRNELYTEMMSTEVPVLPNKIDFTYTDENNNIIVDEQAYENAMKIYSEAVEKYNREQNKLGEEILAYTEQNSIIQLKEVSIANTVELINEYSKTLNEIKDKINKSYNTEEKEKLQKEYDRILSLEKEAIETSKKADDAFISTFGFAPVPPKMSDFTYADENGNFILDEKAYEIAMQKYESDMKNYDEKIAETQNQSDIYNKQLEDINNRAGIVYNKGNNLQFEAKNCKIENEAQQIYQQRLTISNKRNELQEQLMNLERPVPPEKSDFTYKDSYGNIIFDEKAYDNAMIKYNQAITEYENEYNNLQNKLETYSRQDKIFENKLNSLENQRNQLLNYQESLNQIQNAIRNENDPVKKAKLKEKYNITSDLIKNNIENDNKIIELETKKNNLKIPVKPDVSDFIDKNGIIDRKAYIRAMRLYNIDKSLYDAQIVGINMELENLNKYKQNYKLDLETLL